MLYMMLKIIIVIMPHYVSAIDVFMVLVFGK